MTKHNPNLKRISTAISKGCEIAKENGIKKGTGEIFKFKKNGDIKCACALGMAYLGLYGVKKAEEMSNKVILSSKFQLRSIKIDCLKKTVKNTNAIVGANDVEDFIVLLNDGTKIHPSKIAEKLESCGL